MQLVDLYKLEPTRVTWFKLTFQTLALKTWLDPNPGDSLAEFEKASDTRYFIKSEIFPALSWLLTDSPTQLSTAQHGASRSWPIQLQQYLQYVPQHPLISTCHSAAIPPASRPIKPLPAGGSLSLPGHFLPQRDSCTMVWNEACRRGVCQSDLVGIVSVGEDSVGKWRVDGEVGRNVMTVLGVRRAVAVERRQLEIDALKRAECRW
ncbi:hypothetical protein R3P38DRAFT_2765958 [Favolaschia claudopus]|uniref:Uncharacterized protein n=1 Tax=Favolaschia claudopus TaxID=2862362 RepID=A0AAW0CY76_9AGAR